MHIYKSIYHGDISLENVEKEPIELVEREEVVQMFNGYVKNMSKSIYESKQGTGLKVLSPKQMLQRLPIALGQIKAGNNSRSLLNEIRQIVYSLHQSKEITKKVYNNIIKSIAV